MEYNTNSTITNEQYNQLLIKDYSHIKPKSLESIIPNLKDKPLILGNNDFFFTYQNSSVEYNIQ